MNIIHTGTVADDEAMERFSKGMLGFGHPVRARCLMLLGVEHSPSELCELQTQVDGEGNVIKEGPALGVVSYHMRMLREYGLVQLTRTAPKRGALEHFYQRTELAEQMLTALAPVYGLAPQPRRRRTKSPSTLAA